MAESKATWDVAIIGAGGAGLAVAARCLEAGQRVVLFERETPGGRMRQAEAAEALRLTARRAALTGQAVAGNTATPLAEADMLAPFRERGLTVVTASAHFIAPDCLEAAGRTYPFRHAVIAAGSTPVVPDIDGLATVPWLLPEALPTLEEQPEHLLILGGEAEAVALAQAQALLGRRVSLVQAAPNILPGFELELVVPLRERLRRSGVDLHENTAVTAVEHAGAGVALLLGTARLEGSHLLLAAGRAPRLSPLDLAAGQVEATPRDVAVRGDLRSTSNHRVWAVGSVADAGAVDPAPGQHAAVVAATMLRKQRAELSAVSAPRLARTLPALAQLGMTEADARAAGHDPQVLRVPLPDGPFGAEQAKLVADRRGRLLGAALLADGAGEAAALLATAAAHGMTGAEIAALPLPRGTLAEALARAAGNLQGTEFPSSPMQRILGTFQRWQ